MIAPVFTIDHIGINTPDEETARKTAEQLCNIFGLNIELDGRTKIFAGSIFEVKKNIKRGKVGHIALKTDDVDYAMEFLKSRGINVIDDTLKHNEDGATRFVFLDLEIAGFAFQLVS